jgi:protein-tyrosine-phosphatase
VTDGSLEPSQRVPILFLCSGNSARSQLAEALARRLGAKLVDPRSAGSRPRPLHPNAVRILRERGIDISRARPKPLEESLQTRFGYVVTLCDRVREVCGAFERTVDELTVRIRYLLAFLAAQAGDGERHAA